MSSDNYDTSEYSNSVGASITKTLEQKFGLPKRASNVFAENLLRGSDDFHLGDSILGQVSTCVGCVLVMAVTLSLVRRVHA